MTTQLKKQPNVLKAPLFDVKLIQSYAKIKSMEPTTNNPSRDYASLLKEIKADPHALGFILAGSRARNMQKEGSDCDVYIVFDDTVSPDELQTYRKRYNEKYESQLILDISNKALQTIDEFEHYAELGTAYYYDRYNLVHSKLEFDKADGRIAKLLKKKEILSDREQEAITEGSLGNFINLTYRALKNHDVGMFLAASLDATQALDNELSALFGLHGRVRPFNKYLEWELANYPLQSLPWSVAKLLGMLNKILKQQDVKLLKELYRGTEELARQKGFGYKYDAWGYKSRKLAYILE